MVSLKLAFLIGLFLCQCNNQKIDTKKSVTSFIITQAGRGATQDIAAGEQLIEMTASADRAVAMRLHRKWVRGDL